MSALPVRDSRLRRNSSHPGRAPFSRISDGCVCNYQSNRMCTHVSSVVQGKVWGLSKTSLCGYSMDFVMWTLNNKRWGDCWIQASAIHTMLDLKQVQDGISCINDVDVRLVSNLDQHAAYIQQLRLNVTTQCNVIHWSIFFNNKFPYRHLTIMWCITEHMVPYVDQAYF